MKTEFLRSIGYSLHVTETEYGQWLGYLEQHIPKSQPRDYNSLDYQNQIVPIKVSSTLLSNPILNMIQHHNLIGLRR